MHEINKLFLIIISTILVNNFVLTRFLGICPFLGVSKNLGPAWGMGMAVIFVMTMASSATWLVQNFVFVYFDRHFGLQLYYLQTIFFILIIAALVQFIEMVINKTSPALKSALGIYLPLITTNCAVLGVSILNINYNYNFIESTFHGFGGGVGFTMALLLMASIRERLIKAPIPKYFQGAPITLITAALMSIAFLGFTALIPL